MSLSVGLAGYTGVGLFHVQGFTCSCPPLISDTGNKCVDEVLRSSDADRFWNCHDKDLTSLWLQQH